MNPRAYNIVGIILFFLQLGEALGQDSLPDAQRDLTEIYRSKFKSETSTLLYQRDKVSIGLLPVPESGGDRGTIVTTFISSFYMGSDESTRLSVVYFSPYFTLSDQIVLPFRSFIYTNKNALNLTGDYRYMIYPQKTYELGGGSISQEESTVYYKQLRLHQIISKRVRKHFYLGGGVQFDRYYAIEERKLSVDTSEFSKYMIDDVSDFRSRGLAFQIMFDSRSNAVNSESGFFSRTILRMNEKFLGSTAEWNSLYAEMRKYFRIQHKNRNVLAFWGLYWTKLNGSPHYLDLPSIGWDLKENSGRGIRRSRYRSNALLYFEGEYRTDLSKDGLFGAVAFMNVTSPSDFGTQRFRYWYPAIGTGLRLKWNKFTGSNFSFDVAFSEDYWSLYFTLGENF